MARTRWPPICEPRPLAQARQIGPAAPVGARNGTRPTGRSQDNPYGLRPIAGQTGSHPDLTPAATQNHGSRAEALSTSSLPIGLALGAPPPARAAASSGTNYRNPGKSSGRAPPAARPRRPAAVKNRRLRGAKGSFPSPGRRCRGRATRERWYQGTGVACGAGPWRRGRPDSACWLCASPMLARGRGQRPVWGCLSVGRLPWALGARGLGLVSRHCSFGITVLKSAGGNSA